MNAPIQRVLIVAVLLSGSHGEAIGRQLFDAPFRYFPTSGAVFAVAAGKLDRDDIVDLVVSQPDQKTVEVLKGDAEGEFYSQAIIPIANRPRPIAVADFDGDEIPDVVTGGSEPPGLVFLHGLVNGTFEVFPLMPTAVDILHFRVVDLDADGRPDLVIPGGSCSTTVPEGSARQFRVQAAVYSVVSIQTPIPTMSARGSSYVTGTVTGHSGIPTTSRAVANLER